MWVAKIVIPTNDSMLVGSRAKRNNITVMGFPLNHFWKDKKFYLFGSVYIIGEAEAKKAFFKDMKKDKRTIKLDMTNETFGFWLMEQHPSSEMFYNPLIIYSKPLIVANNGDYIFELACWDRKILENIIKKIETTLFNGKLIYFKKGKIENIQIVSLGPNLTEKQKKALDLAIQYRYYGYPRKIEIGKMAKMMNVSYSTFQFHLRNAEKKVIPYIAKTSM